MVTNVHQSKFIIRGVTLSLCINQTAIDALHLNLINDKIDTFPNWKNNWNQWKSVISNVKITWKSVINGYSCSPGYHPQTLGPLPIISLVCPELESSKICSGTHLFLPLGQKEIRKTKKNNFKSCFFDMLEIIFWSFLTF